MWGTATSGPVPSREEGAELGWMREQRNEMSVVQSEIVHVGEKDVGRNGISFYMGQGEWIINHFENIIKSLVPFFHK